MVSSEGSLLTVNQLLKETDVLNMPKKYNIVEIYIKLLFALPYVPRAFQPLRTPFEL
jgi:hypothetical protein